MSRATRTTSGLVVVWLLSSSIAATAQERRGVDLQLVAGIRDSLIESSACAQPLGSSNLSSSGRQAMVGAAVRVHPARGTGLGIEAMFIRRCAQQAFTYYHPRMTIVGQVIRDVWRGQSVRPYVIAAGGYVRHGALYPDPGRTRAVTLAGGGGVRVLLPGRLVLSPEIQIGVDGNLFTRFSVGVGWRLR